MLSRELRVRQDVIEVIEEVQDESDDLASVGEQSTG
jgi:hypothetical protein